MANIGIIRVASLAGSGWALETGGKLDRCIQFKESDVAGRGGCNRFFGHYTSIKIGPVAEQDAFCRRIVLQAFRKSS